jgi:hypothetical protein
VTDIAAPPGTGAPAVPPRRRATRRWWLALLALGVAIAVLTDLPVHAIPAYHRAQLRGYLSAGLGDVAQCQAGVRDAVVAFTGWAAGADGATRGTADTFTRQAIGVCGFANTGIDALGNTEPPRSIASPVVDRLAPALGTWAYLDAFTFLQDLRTLIAHPGSRAGRARVNAALRALSAQRSDVETLAERAERSGRMPATPVRLIRVTSLLPGGALPSTDGARP